MIKEPLEARLVPEYHAHGKAQKDLERKYLELEPYLRLKNRPDVPVIVSTRDGQLYIEPRFGNPSLRDRLTIISKPNGKKPADIAVRLHGFYVEGSINDLQFRILLSKNLMACEPRNE